MYKSTYLTVRVQTAEEVAAVVPTETVDILLWLIDVYRIQTGCEDAVHQLLLRVYHTENERVPGILPRWTKSMMVWVTLLHCRTGCHTGATGATAATLKWAATNNLLVSRAPPQKWSIDQLLLALDALAIRWKRLEDSSSLRHYLHIVWDLARKWTVHRFTTSSRDTETNEGKWHTLKPKAIMNMMARYYWFNQTLAQTHWFPHNEHRVPTHFFQRFMQKEKRHLKISKFRDELALDVWDSLLHYGDYEIATHDQLGDTISAYSCLYKRYPICLMQHHQQLIGYATYEEICKTFAEVLWLKLIQTHFINQYQIDFVKYFVCKERHQHKHQHALHSMTVPILLERFGQYTVLHKGNTHGLGSLEDMFPVWVELADKPYGRNLDMLRDTLFSPNPVQHIGDIQIETYKSGV